MSVSLSLFKVIPDFLNLSFDGRLFALCADSVESFGPKASLIEMLCSRPEFFHDAQGDETSVERWKKFRNEGFLNMSSEPPILTHLIYQYQHNQQQGRVMRYLAHRNPVDCISVKQAYPEDFWPVIECLSDSNMNFLVFDPTCSGSIFPKEFKYSWMDWRPKNFQEDMRSFSY